VIAQLREGLGIATNNAAEYRALILGLTYAAKKGFKYIRAQGDSKLVCNQVSDVWRARHDTMADLCKRVKEIKGRFHTFQINHVLRVGVPYICCLPRLLYFILYQLSFRYGI
jgi:ribonuclease HI